MTSETPQPTKEWARLFDEAQALAHQSGAESVAPEHLLQAMVRVDDGPGYTHLVMAGFDSTDLANRFGGELAPPANTPAGPELRELLGRAERQAAAFGHAWVGPQHILLALLESDFPAALALRELPCDQEDPVAVLRDLLQMHPARHKIADPAAARPQAPPTGFPPDEPTVGVWRRLIESFSRRRSGAPRQVESPFTPGWKEVMRQARNEAGRLGHDYIGPEHFLLGVLRKGEGLAVQVLLNLGVDLEALKVQVERMLKVGSGPTIGIFPQNVDAKRVIDSARKLAGQLHHNWIGTEHLLLALSLEEQTFPHIALNALSVSFDDVKKEVLTLIETPAPGPEAAAEPAPPPPPEDSWQVHAGTLDIDSACWEVIRRVDIFALKYQAPYPGPEHLLLSLVSQPAGLAFQIILMAGIHPFDLRDELERLLPATPPPAASDALAAVLRHAREVALKTTLQRLDTSHLLLALCANPDTVAGKCLASFSLRREQLEELAKAIPRPREQ